MRRAAATAIALLAASLAPGCAGLPSLRPAEPAQALRADAATGQVEVSGVRLSVRADDWHNWLSDVQSRATPVEVAIRNGGEGALLIHPELFALVLPSGGRLAALRPEEVQKALAGVAVADRSGSARTGPDPSRSASLYAWPGLKGRGAAPPVTSLGPDARAIPEGVLESGRSASVLLFFNTPADKLRKFVFEADLQRADGGQIGVARIAFAR